MPRLQALMLLSLFVLSACYRSGTPGEAPSADEARQTFLDLFEMEVQNRAFALLGAQEALAGASSEDDRVFFGTWVEWERFLKEEYAPYASKYGLSQEPTDGAKKQATLAMMAASVLPDRSVMGQMLKETIAYTEKLRDLERVSPEEDRAFFQFVVRQEEAQIESLRGRVDGRHQDAADVLRRFMADHTADSGPNGPAAPTDGD